MSPTYQFIAVLGKRLEYAWHGPGPSEATTLVFLHEGLGSAELWRDFPGTLADACGCGALVYSRAGYGHSDPANLPRVANYLHVEGLEVLLGVLEALEIVDPILIGHSDGGSIALIYAGGATPHSLRGVITEAAHVFNEPIIGPAIRRVTPLYEQGDLRERLAKYHDHVDVAFYGWHNTWLSEAFQNWNIETYLPHIEVPVLILQGEDDRYGTPKQVEAIAHAQPVLLPNCAQTPHQEQTDRVLELMQTLLKLSCKIRPGLRPLSWTKPRARPSSDTLQIVSEHVPLAERLRPTKLSDVAGQQHLVALGKPLHTAIERQRLHSMLFWGPPGVGKTTLARLIAGHFEAHFVPLSAVTSGVKEVRQVAREAAERLEATGERTLLFLDEVHRFNKAQQDLLLPFVEDGTLTLIGATTENPSFEVNGALRSRMQLYVLKALEPEDVRELLERALKHPNGFNGKLKLEMDALISLVAWADGDARRALNALELSASYAEGHILGAEQVRNALSVKGLAFDKGGEHFYNLISALHKSVRGCDPDASLYWLARMLGAGADLMYIARRLVRIASEDVGLADPNALRLAIAARDAAQFLGNPEGELALAECAVYLAIAPKSNTVYSAWKEAQRDAQEYGSAEVPLHLRNAPTGTMKVLGYGKDYAYYFSDREGSFSQRYFPEAMPLRRYYTGDGEGWEKKLASRLESLEQARKGTEVGE